MSFTKTAPFTRWSFLRLMAFWVLWGMVYAVMFHREASFAPMILLCVAGWIRPAPPEGTSTYPSLNGAVAMLVTIPLTAVVIGSELARAFMSSTPGQVLLVVIWLAGIVSDCRFYRLGAWFRSLKHGSAVSLE